MKQMTINNLQLKKIIIYSLIVAILWFGCYREHKGSTISVEKATFTINNNWLEDEEDEIIFLEEGYVQLDVPAEGEKTIVLKAGKKMKRLTLFFTTSGHQIDFFAGIRAGHRYSLGYNPCCLFRIDDMDDDPYEFPGKPVFTDEDGKCPEGMIAIFPGLATDPDNVHRCISASKIRFRIPSPVLNEGPVFVYIGKDIGNEKIRVDKVEKNDYFTFDIVRSGSPETVRLVQKSNVLWEGYIVFRVKHSYTLEYQSSESIPVLVHMDD